MEKNFPFLKKNDTAQTASKEGNMALVVGGGGSDEKKKKKKETRLSSYKKI